MDIEAIRRYCLDFPHTSEVVQWGGALVLKVDGKMFAVAALEPGPARLSLKASGENFVELCERPDIIPAPYMARAQWVCLQRLNAVPDWERRELLAEAYRLVFEKLPKKRQAELHSNVEAKATRVRRSADNLTDKKISKNLTSKKSKQNLTGKKIVRHSGRAR